MIFDGQTQYKFVYDCLEEAYLNGQTWFPVSDLSQKLKHKSVKNSLTKLNEYQREYEVCDIYFSISQFIKILFLKFF